MAKRKDRMQESNKKKKKMILSNKNDEILDAAKWTDSYKNKCSET